MQKSLLINSPFEEGHTKEIYAKSHEFREILKAWLNKKIEECHNCLINGDFNQAAYSEYMAAKAAEAKLAKTFFDIL